MSDVSPESEPTDVADPVEPTDVEGAPPADDPAIPPADVEQVDAIADIVEPVVGDPAEGQADAAYDEAVDAPADGIEKTEADGDTLDGEPEPAPEPAPEPEPEREAQIDQQAVIARIVRPITEPGGHPEPALLGVGVLQDNVTEPGVQHTIGPDGAETSHAPGPEG